MTEDQLDALIGLETEIDGHAVRVVDWVPEGPSLVLASAATGSGIQTDQYGDARRRAPETWTVPVYDPGTGARHPVISAVASD